MDLPTVIWDFIVKCDAVAVLPNAPYDSYSSQILVRIKTLVVWD